MRKIISTDNAPAAVGPYSQAILLNDVLYVSGQIPLVPGSGDIVPGGIREQASRVLDNLKEIVSASGCDFENIVKCTCFLKDMGDFAEFNDVYAAYFGNSLPARECVEVARLPKDVLVEVSAICGV